MPRIKAKVIIETTIHPVNHRLNNNDMMTRCVVNHAIGPTNYGLCQLILQGSSTHCPCPLFPASIMLFRFRQPVRNELDIFHRLAFIETWQKAVCVSVGNS